jgi:hypothetical protein
VLAASTSETSVHFYQTNSATTQKTAIFILATVRTSNLTTIWKTKKEMGFNTQMDLREMVFEAKR